MSEFKAVIFDADGVVIKSGKVFSLQYAEKYGIDPSRFGEFFRNDFKQALIGKADLKELIVKHRDIWHWDNDPQELLDMWFDSENQTDAAVMEIIRQIRLKNIPTFMATNQEKYRGQYLRDVLFAGIFDDVLVSADLGYTKDNTSFWSMALGRLSLKVPGIQPPDIIFFDDSQECIDGALSAGFSAHLYENVTQLRAVLDIE